MPWELARLPIGKRYAWVYRAVERTHVMTTIFNVGAIRNFHVAHRPTWVIFLTEVNRIVKLYRPEYMYSSSSNMLMNYNKQLYKVPVMYSYLIRSFCSRIHELR